MKKIELESKNGYDRWVEVKKNGKSVKAEKKDSKPVFNESTYHFSLEGGELEFESGKKSCSGAGKFRSTSPSDEVVEAVKEALEGVGA